MRPAHRTRPHSPPRPTTPRGRGHSQQCHRWRCRFLRQPACTCLRHTAARARPITQACASAPARAQPRVRASTTIAQARETKELRGGVAGPSGPSRCAARGACTQYHTVQGDSGDQTDLRTACGGGLEKPPPCTALPWACKERDSTGTAAWRHGTPLRCGANANLSTRGRPTPAP